MSQPQTWKCEVCGYIHRGSSPPDICPVCGVGQEMFVPFVIAEPSAPASEPRWRCTVCDYVHQGEAPPSTCPVCGAEQSLFAPDKAHPSSVVKSSERGDIVIIGGGIAGLSAAEQARLTSPEARITLISKEPELPYYRLNLTRLLAGEVEDPSLAMAQHGWFEEQRIELLSGEVSAIDRQQQRVQLRDQQTRTYDRLVLANGAHPFVPPLPGMTLTGVFAFRTLADSRAIAAYARSVKQCLCLGGGLLGLETAGALARQGLTVTVLEGFDWLLPRQLAEPAGRLLQQHMERAGIQVRCGVMTEAILGDERVRAARLAGGEEIATDLLILSTGVRPNSYLARQCGLEVKQGVIVDDQMVTSDPHILAAGDVAEHRGRVYGIWPASYAQGVIAGTNAAGGELQWPGMAPSNRLKVLDVDLFSIGQWHPEDGSYEVVEEQRPGFYQRFTCRDGRLVGANLYGDTSLANIVKEAVESSAQLATLPELLARVPRLAERCPSTSQKQPKE